MQASRTVVLNCAGIGSRLGLGRTKVLMEINGKSLLSLHLANFAEVEDLRIVVGFQANDVIRATLAIRPDVTFVYNHDYFDTKTGYSLGLAARYAENLVLTFDGDAIIHPEDARKCLEHGGPFLAYSDFMTQDAIGCEILDGMATTFTNDALASQTKNVFEWTGIACVPRDILEPLNAHVYEIITPALPLPAFKIRAMDIDTYDDYRRAATFMKEWSI